MSVSPGQVAGGSPQDRLDARHELREAERLRDVVVAAGPERLDLVLGRVLRGQEEHRGLEPARPQPAPDLDPLDVGQHPVEHDQVRLLPRHCLERLAARGRLGDVVALVPKRGRDRVDDRLLVVDDEDALAVGAHSPMVAAIPVNRLRGQALEA